MRAQRTRSSPSPLTRRPSSRRILTVLLCAFAISASAALADSPGPSLPFFDWGACPFECCTYRAWGVTKETVVWKERRRSSAEAFRLKPGDRVVAVTGVVITTKAGRMRILQDTTLDQTKPVRLHAGDVIYTLRYMGEGYDRFWFDGELHSDQISATKIDSGSPPRDAILWVEALPRTVWWVKVRNDAGVVGWTLVDDNFDGVDMDACS